MKTMRYSNYHLLQFMQHTALIIKAEQGLQAMMATIMSADNTGIHMGYEPEGELDLAEPITKTKRPPMYKVVLLNDDFTPMDFVVSVIEHIYRKDHEEAVELMLMVHEKGQAIVGIYTREVAETKVDQTVEYARINDHPLQCAMEQE